MQVCIHLVDVWGEMSGEIVGGCLGGNVQKPTVSCATSASLSLLTIVLVIISEVECQPIVF